MFGSRKRPKPDGENLPERASGPPVGARFGPYEILESIGSGGMGQVYRARDSRFSRDVAIKFLRESLQNDPTPARRFQEEARLLAQINHPNILNVFDTGEYLGVPYLVTELLDGAPLDEILASGALPLRKLLDYAVQAARALAAAHRNGIVHRDLKPSNIFVLREGRVKVLDFGLAKRPQRDAANGSSEATETQLTEANTIVGTVSYMSPEQVSRQPLDSRSDLFSFGIVLFEMATARRPFTGASTVDVMHAVLHTDPPSVDPAPLDRIIRRCLEKNPAQRFQDADVLAFALEQIAVPDQVPAGPQPAPVSAPWIRRSAVAALAVVLLAAGALGWRLMSRQPASVTVLPLTFRRGLVQNARFTTDSSSILYSAEWEGGPSEIFSARPGHSESQELGMRREKLLDISRSGELLVLFDYSMSGWQPVNGKLGRVPLGGSAPRPLLDGVSYACWAHAGDRYAMVRQSGGRERVEFPAGTKLYETSGWISDLRLSPNDDALAFGEHPNLGDDQGHIVVISARGNVLARTADYASAQGVAWEPSGREVWYTAGIAELRLFAIQRNGRVRTVLETPGSLMLFDIGSDGRALMAHQSFRGSMILAARDGQERDLSWLDDSSIADISADGRTLLFWEGAAGSGPESNYSTYIRGVDGSPAIRLGDGQPIAFSVDAKWALSLVRRPRLRLLAVPTGTGETRELKIPAFESIEPIGGVFRDGRRVLVAARFPGRGVQYFVVDSQSGAARAITPEGIGVTGWSMPLSPDESYAAAHDATGSIVRYAVDAGSQPRSIPGTTATDQVIQWAADGRSIFVYSASIPVSVVKVDIESGRRKPWKTIGPTDRAGLFSIAPVRITPDERTYSYAFSRALSQLYLIAGLR